MSPGTLSRAKERGRPVTGSGSAGKDFAATATIASVSGRSAGLTTCPVHTRPSAAAERGQGYLLKSFTKRMTF